MTIARFLPATRAEMAERGWDAVDVVLVSGDAYIDHPSFGIALIGRWLEAHGLRVAVLAQPRHDRPDDFARFGRPRLFFGITAGNLDSVVANYSGNARVRDQDDYSPGGNPYFGSVRDKAQRRRPDRASIVYANLARAACADVPVVLGGLEASLRRFVHFDYQQAKLRGSLLTDAKADLLVYGMGEHAVLTAAQRLAAGQGLAGIAGTCVRLSDRELVEQQWSEPPLRLPSWEEINQDRRHFLTAERTIDQQARAFAQTPLLQRQQAMWVLQQPPAAPLTTAELDRLHGLPFCRAPHPTAGDVPAYRMIRHSITIVRGCNGNCSFCAIARHQGPVITSRSQASVVAEVKEVVAMPDFTGTISDLGGPTANLYGSKCASPTTCRRHDCLFPAICRHLALDEARFLALLQECLAVPGVRHVFVSSGLRMELLLRTPALLEQLTLHHTPGAMKIAPEHTEPKILALMHKPGAEVLADFLALCRKIASRHKRNVLFTPYWIASHPGCTQDDMQRLAARAKELNLPTRQLQDFTPTPGTLATAMYVAGLHRDTLTPIPVARTTGERRAQRLALEGTPGLRPRHRQR
ncbi:MAG: YgiQ family radical SAM protein [Desulfobacterales bacterium CG2_30_60_27]|nr:MAG: YgiQ family radical SAM protein [Desulfobacterales bacterium CG2_30_60_27]